jgi:alpha-L-fucosidase
MPDGRIENRQVEILTEMGQWLSDNQEAVYGTRGGPYLPTEKMVSTHKENKIYLHLLGKPGRKLVLPLEESISVKDARFLQDNTSLKISRDNETITLQLPKKLPDEVANVIVLELATPASEIDLIKL